MNQNLQRAIERLESSVIKVLQSLLTVMEHEKVDSSEVTTYLRFILIHQPDNFSIQSAWTEYINDFRDFKIALGKVEDEPNLAYEMIDQTLMECLDLNIFKVLYMQKVYNHFQMDFDEVQQKLHTKFYFFNPPPQEKYRESEKNTSERSRSCILM